MRLAGEDVRFETSPASFERVEAVSRQLDRLHGQWTSALVRMWASPQSDLGAELMFERTYAA